MALCRCAVLGSRADRLARVKILIVIDQFDGANNGTTISARRFAKALIERGNEVRVVTCRADISPEELTAKDGIVRWTVPPLSLPGFNGIIAKQGIHLGRGVKPVLREAIEWADVVHVSSPFWIGQTAKKVADAAGVPSTAAFHVQPQNLTYNFRLGRSRAANALIYRAFRPLFNHFKHVHCPSQFIADELLKNGYNAKLHVVSNGVDPAFQYRKEPKRPEFEGKKIVLMIGRLSPEKRQDVLIEAVRRSSHADQIQVVLAGRGPWESKLVKAGATLANPPIIGFYSEDELRQLLAETDLYVHASDAEIEGISCIEAFTSGLVPVIAHARMSATPQFALDPRSLFTAGSPTSLAERIDYWLSHDDERIEMEHRYAAAGAKYSLPNSVEQIEAMFAEAIADAD